MDTTTQILENLHRLPEKFEENYKAGAWNVACDCYEMAIMVSTFVHMDKEPRNKMISGFDQRKVQDAFKRAGRWVENADRKADKRQAV